MLEKLFRFHHEDSDYDPPSDTERGIISTLRGRRRRGYLTSTKNINRNFR